MQNDIISPFDYLSEAVRRQLQEQWAIHQECLMEVEGLKLHDEPDLLSGTNLYLPLHYFRF